MEYFTYSLVGSAASVYILGTDATKNFMPFIPINTALTMGVFYFFPFSQNPIAIVLTSAVVMKVYEQAFLWMSLQSVF
jgi:hypothetical protein